MWFLRDLARLDREMAGVAELAKLPWIERVQWQVDADSGLLRAEVDFRAGGRRRQAWLTYPAIFPGAPPRVTPRHGNERWSRHQWGIGAELCLQIRSDNWHSRLTGADMLRSARVLLDTEAIKDEQGHARHVLSEHRFTEGQRMMGFTNRLIATKAVLDKVRQQPGPCPAMFHMSVGDTCVVYTAVKLTLSNASTWLAPDVPPLLIDSGYSRGLAAAVLPDDPRIDLAKTGLAADLWAAFSTDPLTQNMLLMLVLPEGLLCYRLDPASQKITLLGTPRLDHATRLAARHVPLAAAKVGILGAGSMGGKVALSLARAGVRDFVLLDDDLLSNGNVVRHDLDWLSVGVHKAEGVKQRLQAIAAGMQVTVFYQRLGGQTSSKLLASMLDALGSCSLIVDASGSATGFNYAAAVVERSAVPLVWGRVFAGGYGGYIARSRPGRDPLPLDAREQIDLWCANPEFPEPPAAGETDYSAAEDDQPPMIADDADVGVISAHLARFAIDLLATAANPANSAFPHSAYMIGLREEWIFTEPFDTRPIPLVAATGASAAVTRVEDRVGEMALRLLKEHA
jgi:molybdopterin/thiamine biosynthesis adenylyltransferase